MQLNAAFNDVWRNEVTKGPPKLKPERLEALKRRLLGMLSLRVRQNEKPLLKTIKDVVATSVVTSFYMLQT